MSSIRTNLVAGLAPVAPPCFPARDIWVEYLKSAAEYGGNDPATRPTPLLAKRGEVPRFNYDYNFCADCPPEYAAAMARADRCKPLHLRVLGLQKVIPIAIAVPVSAGSQLEVA